MSLFKQVVFNQDSKYLRKAGIAWFLPKGGSKGVSLS